MVGNLKVTGSLSQVINTGRIKTGKILVAWFVCCVDHLSWRTNDQFSISIQKISENMAHDDPWFCRASCLFVFVSYVGFHMIYETWSQRTHNTMLCFMRASKECVNKTKAQRKNQETSSHVVLFLLLACLRNLLSFTRLCIVLIDIPSFNSWMNDAILDAW